MTIQNVGLKTSGVPPLGVGVAPSLGRLVNGVGVVDPPVGAWSSGPGAIAWHADQWVIPLNVEPGRTIFNVSCDVWNPNTGTAVTDTIELLSSSGGVLGSVPTSASTTVVTRGWIILLDGFQVPDGGQLMLRHSPRNNVGAWSAGPVTAIACNVNSTPPRVTHTHKLSPIGGTNVGSGVFQTSTTGLTGNWYPVNDGDLLGVVAHVRDGERLETLNASVYGNTTYTVTMSMKAQDDAFHAGARLGNEQTSLAQNSSQTLAVVPSANDNSGNNETVTTSSRAYYVQFLAHRLAGPGDGGSLYVGPITLVTSSVGP